ncbi:ankyrin repeat domain-containing protein [Ruegeria sp.]|uniref:ankyrin repeat domain-containing protein n=1 Tax=Ruegeria sp. TaxID=1879320 RepID=UPI003B5CB600
MTCNPLCRVVTALVLLAVFVEPANASPLINAARDGDLAKVESLLNEGTDVNVKTVATPLYFAAQRGHLDVVELLVSRGADVNIVTDFGTALQIAARGNKIEIVELLLKNGADPNISGGDKHFTPLHDAAERGAMEAAQLLLANGADINSRAQWDQPPIHLAAFKERSEMVSFLQEQGAAPLSVEPLTESELATADIEEGRARVLACKYCHAVEKEEETKGPAPGPHLWNIVGRERGGFPDYPYSDAMKALDGTWTFEELNRFLADPTGNVPGTAMGHGHEIDRTLRVAVIAYLRTQSDDPLPLE